MSYSKSISVIANPYEGIQDIDFQANNYYEVGESVVLSVIAYPMNLKITDVAFTSSDTSIATVSGTNVSFIKAGNVEIEAYVVKYDLTFTKNILVIDAIPTSVELNLDATYYTNSVAPVEMSFTPSNAYSDVTWDVHPHNVCYYDNGELQFTDAGIATIEVTSSLTGELLFIQDITVIKSNQVVVNAEYKDQEIIFEGRKYELGKTAFATVQDAINNASEDAEILVTQAEIEENITINSNKITLYGLNKDTAGYDERGAETTMYCKITINEGVSDITIQGFAFTSNSLIELEGDNDNITISNNYFHDTTLNPDAWVEDLSYDGGIIKFDSSSKFCDNVIIQNNYFKDIDEVALNYQQILNLKVMGNKFEDFSRDAIRSTKTIPNNNCQWVFKDNSFINGSYNGLMFRGYGTEADGLIQTISIYNNYFNNVGRVDELFSNAISFRDYYEGVTNVNISYNTFKDCDNYILLRNNAESENQDNWYGYIYYNAFLGEPDSFYFKNKNTSDSISSNPNQAILKYNFYGDIAGNSITPSSSKFDGALVNSNDVTDISSLENISYLYGQNIAYINSTCTMSATTDGVWSSSDTLIATVSETGVVSCKQAGDVTISFLSSDGIKTNIDLKVEESPNIDYASLLVSIALAEEGYVEIGTNYTKYGVWYSEQVNSPSFAYGAWCAMFVSWCADQAGIPRTVIPLYASVSAGRSWFEGKGLF
ncbi:MAG: Ig-like domain-containing protein, partial [Bacilli bacterium]